MIDCSAENSGFGFIENKCNEILLSLIVWCKFQIGIKSFAYFAGISRKMTAQVSPNIRWSSRESPWFCVHHDHMYCSSPRASTVVQVIPAGSGTQRRQITQVTDQHGKTLTLSLLKPGIFGEDEAGQEQLTALASTSGLSIVTSPKKVGGKSSGAKKGITLTLLTEGDKVQVAGKAVLPSEAKSKTPVPVRSRAPSARQKARKEKEKEKTAKSLAKKGAAASKAQQKKGQASKKGKKVGVKKGQGKQDNGETEEQEEEEILEEELDEEVEAEVNPSVPESVVDQVDNTASPGARTLTRRQLTRQKEIIESQPELAMHLLSTKQEIQGKIPIRRKEDDAQPMEVQESPQSGVARVRFQRKLAQPHSKKTPVQKNKQAKDSAPVEPASPVEQTSKRVSHRGRKVSEVKEENEPAKQNETKPKVPVSRKRGRPAKAASEEQEDATKEETDMPAPEPVVKTPQPNKKRKKSENIAKEDVELMTIKFTPCDVAAAAGDPWGQAMPMEILVKIFLNVVKDEGFIPVVGR